jgi:long-chain acyl-CoA synthetase
VNAETEYVSNSAPLPMTAGDRLAPMLFEGFDTSVRVFRNRCEKMGNKIAHREKGPAGWGESSWQDYYERSRLIGLGLIARGLQRGETVSILADNSAKWIYTDVAVQCVGGVSSGIYTTDAPTQVSYLLADSDTKILFVDTAHQLEKVRSILGEVPGLRLIVTYDDALAKAEADPRVISYGTLCNDGKALLAQQPDRFEAEIARARPEDIAVLVYTSGTTGAAKGAMISHRNMVCSMRGAKVFVPVEEGDEQICFLPLCHILERCNSILGPMFMGSTVSFAESPRKVLDNLPEVRPHVLTAAPRIWEKIYSRCHDFLMGMSPEKRGEYDDAIRIGGMYYRLTEEGKPVPQEVQSAFAEADRRYLAKLRGDLGLDRLKYGLSGAAPIAADLLEWMGSIGLNIREGYGMTESSGMISCNLPGRRRVGSVGEIEPNGEVRISELGEIQYRGGKVFAGYRNLPETTAESFTEDGWLRTGDLGRIGPEGHLYITGRMKDIIITAGGKNVSPAEIENRLKFSPYISDAMVIGDARPYLTCLIMIDAETVGAYARDIGAEFESFAELCELPQVQKLIQSQVDTANSFFAQVEQIKKFRLLNVLISPQDEEVTATMKLKRSLVRKKYKDLADSMYL